MSPRDRAILAVLLGAGVYVWVAHVEVMAAALLVFLVVGMLWLSILAMLRRDRRRLTETKPQRVLRLVNERVPTTREWR